MADGRGLVATHQVHAILFLFIVGLGGIRQIGREERGASTYQNVFSLMV